LKHIVIDVPTNELHLYPISDVQVGAAGCDTAAFREHIEEALTDPLARFFGGGDYTDSLSPSNRKYVTMGFVKGDLYDTPKKMLEQMGKQHAQDFIRLIKGTEMKWDFLLKGHHLNEYTIPYPDGTHLIRTTDHDIADYVGAPYLGEPGASIGQALISYRFPAPSKGRKRPVLRLFAVHGQGGGGSLAAPFTQLERMARGFNAHIYYVAHHHKVGAMGIVKLHEEPEAATRLLATDSRLVVGGSFLKGYMPDEVGYAEDGMMVPLSIGAPVIYASARPNGTFKVRVLV
jgi:hypothetical protein